MQPSKQIWHTQMPPQDVAGELQTNSQPDCPICLITYDNIFKTPKSLECTHVFCLECLSRIMAASRTNHQDGGGSSTHLFCPYCRQPTPLPENGPPALPTCHEMLCKLPSHQQQEEPVWLEADKLCYKSPRQNFAWEASGSSVSLCIGVDVGDTKQMNSPNTWNIPYTLVEDKRVLLVFLLFLLGMLIFIIVVLIDCFKTTKNANCENALP